MDSWRGESICRPLNLSYQRVVPEKKEEDLLLLMLAFGEGSLSLLTKFNLCEDSAIIGRWLSTLGGGAREVVGWFNYCYLIRLRWKRFWRSQIFFVETRNVLFWCSFLRSFLNWQDFGLYESLQLSCYLHGQFFEVEL